MMEYGGKIIFLGCGSVAQCVFAMLSSFIAIPPTRLTIIDFVDQREKIKTLLAEGARFVQKRMTPENYAHILQEHLSPGDLLIDLAWNVDTASLIEWCHLHDVRFINTSVEVWDPYSGARDKHPTELTLYHRQMHLRNMSARWNKFRAPTAIVDHGANPGLVSHFAKQALLEIAYTILQKDIHGPRKKSIEIAIADQQFAEIAKLIGLKTIHISERDTQITDKPKEVNEFVNTWSAEGFIEEGVAPSEIGWGSHEVSIPKGAFFHATGPQNQICLAQKGTKTWVRSWVPSGPITGMVIRHGEAFSISDYLTIRDGDTVIYRPTVHYAYCPCDAAVNSMHELEMRDFTPQSKQRILTNEIISGNDELGCLLMGHDLGAWWIGSVLDIGTARSLARGHNATVVQVAAGVASSAAYALKYPHLGFCLPDHLNHEEILAFAKPFLGNFISMPVTWSPLDRAEAHANYGMTVAESIDPWQFSSFALSPSDFVPMPSDLTCTCR